VAGQAALLVDPHNTAQIAEGLVRLITQADLRHQLVERGYQQILLFSWSKAAQQVLRILEAVASSQKPVVSSQKDQTNSRSQAKRDIEHENEKDIYKSP
jgi:hypothetical protein